jgi:CDP-glycerol glycerophosphotransferase (TagB/SpsB family)
LPPRLQLVQLGVKPSLKRRFARLLNTVAPVDKLALYGDNLEFFRGLDALVVTEKTSLLLKTHYGLSGLCMIHTRHGAGDRAIGFDRASQGFDHVLASGPKIRDRLIEDARVPSDRISVVGYPKFDLEPERSVLPMQANGRPTVLYNPHGSPHLSSWYLQGRGVLEYFRTSERYNLIFAPHVMLFQRPYVVSVDRLRIARVGKLDPRLYETPHIHIDLGSHASTDMTYTTAADIYLGDVSSQVYEFLRRPRPCVFLNAHDRSYEGDPNFAHWAAGPVISRLDQLDCALTYAVEHQGQHEAVQRRLFDYSFDLTVEPSCERAATAIRHAMDQCAGAASP